MTQLEYLVALISIIVGLGLTELAQSVRELIRPGHPVRWDGLPLAWSAFVFLFTILLWWNGFFVLKEREEAGPIFLSYLLVFFLLYLCCAFVLPDPDWEEGAPPSVR
jgi:apolipoprotein N-acyltransferase